MIRRSCAAVFAAVVLSLAACPETPATEGEGEGEGDIVGEGEGEVVGEGEGDVGEGEGDVVGEGEGEGEVIVVGDLVINEVGCRGSDFVELKNNGVADVDLSGFTIGTDVAVAGVPVSGVLAPGAVASFALIGIGCDKDDVVVTDAAGVVVDRVHPPLLPVDASFGRVPDGTGAFTRATPTAGAANTGYVDAAARLFTDLDTPVPATLPQLRITFDAATDAALRADPGSYVEAAVSFVDAAGSVDVDAGLRIKGQSVLRTLDQKAAFKIDFDRFVAGNHLFGIEKLTLNNLVQDNSATHERLYYGLLARQGLAASRTGYVEVFVNDVFFGVYIALEATDDEGFLGRSFSSTQLLYEGEYGQDLFVGNEAQFDDDFGNDPTRVVLSTITRDLDGATGATLMGDTSDTIDWNRLLPQMATDFFCGHWDSYGPTKNNFTFHIDDDGRLSLITGGADQAFTEAVSINDDPGLHGRLLNRCLEDASCAAAVFAAEDEVAADVTAWLDGGGAARLRADALTLRTHLTADTRREWDAQQIPTLVDDAIAFITASAAAL